MRSYSVVLAISSNAIRILYEIQSFFVLPPFSLDVGNSSMKQIQICQKGELVTGICLPRSPSDPRSQFWREFEVITNWAYNLKVVSSVNDLKGWGISSMKMLVYMTTIEHWPSGANFFNSNKTRNIFRRCRGHDNDSQSGSSYLTWLSGFCTSENNESQNSLGFQHTLILISLGLEQISRVERTRSPAQPLNNKQKNVADATKRDLSEHCWWLAQAELWNYAAT
jgi:hypothetical protein